MAEKKLTGTPAVKSVTLADVKAAEGQAAGGTVSASSAKSDDTEAKDLDGDIKDLDRREKTTSTKDLDTRGKQADKTAKTQDGNDRRIPYNP